MNDLIGNINEDLIGVNNGILNTRTGELVEPTPEIFVPIRIPVTYNKEAICPEIDNFFKDITTDKRTGIQNENDLLSLYEMVGYILEPDYPIKKAIMLKGPGSSGKSIMLNLLFKFCGKHFSALDFKDLGNRFAIVNLENKLCNIKDDLGYSLLNEHAHAMFKQLTSGSCSITVKGVRQDYSQFENRAKFYFACIHLPKVKLSDRVFIERWVIINLPNSYTRNPEFLSKLTSESELSGLLNAALEAKDRLIKQGMFSKSKEQDFEELHRMFKSAIEGDDKEGK